MKDSGRPHNFKIQLWIKGLHTLKYCGDGLRGCVMVLLEMPCKDAFSTCTQTIMASADELCLIIRWPLKPQHWTPQEVPVSPGQAAQDATTTAVNSRRGANVEYWQRAY